MSHIIAKKEYKSLVDRLNKFPQGAPESKTLYEILSVLFTEREAYLVSKLPIGAFRVKTAARIWTMTYNEALKVLDTLASRAILLDIEDEKGKKYILPPPMAGFIEFTLMRTNGDLNQKLLSELYYQYLNVEEDFIKDLFFSSETKMGRVFVQEEVLSNENKVDILDFEKATHIIETSKHIAVGICYCRHKMKHLGKSCDAPMEVCLTFGNTANSLIKNNYARRIDVVECKELLYKAYEHNLVQCGENVREEVSFICNCCGCCCDGLLAAKKFGHMHPIQTTGFYPVINDELCIKCGKCEKMCPIDAISLVKDNMGEKKFEIDYDVCLGCGVCARNCSKGSIILKRREEKIITPFSSVHRVVLQAIEKGTLLELISETEAFKNHRVMASIFSAILKMSPVKQLLARDQVKSIYLDKLLSIKK